MTGLKARELIWEGNGQTKQISGSAGGCIEDIKDAWLRHVNFQLYNLYFNKNILHII